MKHEARDMKKGFRKLDVWQEAHEFVIIVYKNTAGFPREELFGLTSQIRRAVVSVTANIVEGYDDRSDKKFLQFLTIANGSLAEVEYYLLLAEELEYLSEEQYQCLEGKRAKVGAYLNKFTKAVKNRIN